MERPFGGGTPSPEYSSTVWPFIIAFVAALIWALLDLPRTVLEIAPLFHAHQDPQLYGTIAGHVTVVSLIVCLIVFVLFRGRFAGRGLRAVVYFFVITIAVTAIDAGIINSAKTSADLAGARNEVLVADIRSTVKAYLKNPDTAKVDLTVHATGDAGVAEKLLKQFLARVLADRKQCDSDITASGYSEAFKPAALADDDGLKEARATIKRMRLIVAKCKALNDQRIVELRAQIANLNIAPEGKQQMLSGFEASMAQNSQLRDRLWTIRESLIDQHEQIVDLLATSKGNWTARHGKLLFYEHADLVAFNEHVEKIKELVAEEERIHKFAIDSVSEKASDGAGLADQSGRL